MLGMNYFILAFCLFNSVLLLVDFFIRYFKMANEGDFLKYHQEGKKSFFSSWNTWATYIPFVVLLFVYNAFKQSAPWNSIIPAVFILAGIVKVFWEYGKTPIAKVLSGEDESIIGKFFKTANSVGSSVGGGSSKDSKKGGGTVIEFTGGILGEVVNQVGGLGREALRQTTGVGISEAPAADKKAGGGDKKK